MGALFLGSIAASLLVAGNVWAQQSQSWRARAVLNKEKSTGQESCLSTKIIVWTFVLKGDRLTVKDRNWVIPVRSDGTVDFDYFTIGGNSGHLAGSPWTKTLTIANTSFGCTYDLQPVD